ncbi:hypothetical protein [Flavobacterium psychrophilum]|uniref:hypothetical protein n=1 Tax=Flavobacterium psychrophilum TaxID=96345 RepID=UPI001D0873D7|nr:hypothetical protein [Flavobacterium psychrophilum]MCB6098873.1 hypothetical protein [Flavobacterium psychrophilum]
MQLFFKQFGEDLKKNIPGFIAVTITEVRTGIVYYSQSEDPNYDSELSSSFCVEIVRAKMNSIVATNLKYQKIDTIIINLTSQIHLIDLSDNGKYFIYLIINDNKNFNLGITKLRLNRYKQEIKLVQQKKK